MLLSVGILVIGSLYWEDDPVREEWRNSRLEFSTQYTVSAPIRYGRLSSSRGNTYTMVFSLLCTRQSHRLGIAKAISLRHTIETPNQLIEEAEHLWAVEQHQSRPNGYFSAGWGCVALLVNPASQVPQDLLNRWTERVADEARYGELAHTKSEGRCVTSKGFLNIPWPRLLEDATLLPMDILLATATNPTLTNGSANYPRIRKIARAWRQSTANNEEYFWRNYENGIRTYQDETILKILKQRRNA